MNEEIDCCHTNDMDINTKDDANVVEYNAHLLKKENEDIELQELITTSRNQRTVSINSINDRNDILEDNSNDEFAVRFSAAQVKTKVAQARHESKVVAENEILKLKKEMVEQQYEIADLRRDRMKALAQVEDLQMRLDTVLQDHKQKILVMRENLGLEKLLETLDVEKAVRQKLELAFEKQQQTLTLAEERVKNLDGQVAMYQKTETVLAQSVVHLQHRFASKDEQRVASVEHVQRELIEQHEQEMTKLRQELAIVRGTEKIAQEKLQELQDNAQQKVAAQENIAMHDQELQLQITQLETEKAVLLSKLEQVQKADTQLRSQFHAQSADIAVLQQEKEKLQQDNKELGEIASDLMQMAERQHCENANCSIISTRLLPDASIAAPGRSYEEDSIFLQKRKKRLRLSLN